MHFMKDFDSATVVESTAFLIWWLSKWIWLPYAIPSLEDGSRDSAKNSVMPENVRFCWVALETCGVRTSQDEVTTWSSRCTTVTKQEDWTQDWRNWQRHWTGTCLGVATPSTSGWLTHSDYLKQNGIVQEATLYKNFRASAWHANAILQGHVNRKFPRSPHYICDISLVMLKNRQVQLLFTWNPFPRSDVWIQTEFGNRKTVSLCDEPSTLANSSILHGPVSGKYWSFAGCDLICLASLLRDFTSAHLEIL